MNELMKKIEEVKTLMSACNVTHLEINKYRQRNEDGYVYDYFEMDVHQDDHNKPWNRTRTYAGYSSRR